MRLKLLCLLLVFCLTCALLVSCKDSGGGESGAAESSEIVETSSPGDESSESSRDYVFQKSEQEPYKKNVALNASYTLSAAPHSDYPDVGGKLTDGKLAASANFLHIINNTDKMKDYWLGFYTRSEDWPGELVVDLDLGKEYSDIMELEISSLHDSEAGISVPGRVDFYIYENGEYRHVGTHLTPKSISWKMKYSISLNLEEGISTEKIRFVISEMNSTWAFIEEASVYLYTEEDESGNNNDDYFNNVKIPVIDEPTYWDNNQPDYNEKQNLLLGLAHQMRTSQKLDEALKTEYYNNTESSLILTDGKKDINALYSDPTWFHCTRGLEREIIYTLDNISAVDSAEIGFLNSVSVGIVVPQWLDILISENGEDWQTVYSTADIATDGDPGVVRVTADFGGSYRAKYIIFKFRISGHCWIDEIEIFGTKNASDAAAVVPDGEKSDNSVNSFPSPDEFDGMNNMLLAYFSNGADKKITMDKYYPQVVYIKDREAKDWMFDSFLYLPDSTFVKNMNTKSDWENYHDLMFIDDGNLKELEKAVAKGKEELDQPDYKVKVILSVPEPLTNVDFGEIDGRKIDSSKLEDRIAVIEWFVQKLINSFNSCGFENLELYGFYWHEEAVYSSDNFKLVQYFNEYVQSMDYISVWIPYYIASGFESWKELGFSIANMQPNYAFDLSVTKDRLYESIDLSKRLGMGVEIEINSLDYDYVDRMKEYYYACAEAGAMKNSVLMYYTAGMPGAIYGAFANSNPYLNSLYDSTYYFIKGSFATNPAGPDNADINCVKDEAVTGILTGSPVDFVKRYYISVSPTNGTLRINMDGSYEYTPNEGFTGTDHFEVKYDYGFAKSNPARINITVG